MTPLELHSLILLKMKDIKPGFETSAVCIAVL